MSTFENVFVLFLDEDLYMLQLLTVFFEQLTKYYLNTLLDLIGLCLWPFLVLREDKTSKNVFVGLLYSTVVLNR